MSNPEFKLTLTSLEEMPDDDLRSAFKVLTFAVQYAYESGNDMAREAAGRDAELFGMELVRRHLI